MSHHNENETRITVERTIDAPADAIFEVLSNPKRHAELDGSGFIRSDERTNRVQQVGDVFTMNMDGQHMDGEYQTDNHVTGFDENRLIAWQTAPAGTEPKGWQWVWELEAQGPDATLVRHTYDWGNVTDEALLKKVGFPLVSQSQLEDTLAKLAEAVSS
ncbi:MAG: SRPBCC family protein [Actinomycetia bacterium]|nr:SRPBCC family protein [Actinomycetes bacterium]